MYHRGKEKSSVSNWSPVSGRDCVVYQSPALQDCQDTQLSYSKLLEVQKEFGAVHWASQSLSPMRIWSHQIAARPSTMQCCRAPSWAQARGNHRRWTLSWHEAPADLEHSTESNCRARCPCRSFCCATICRSRWELPRQRPWLSRLCSPSFQTQPDLLPGQSAGLESVCALHLGQLCLLGFSTFSRPS